MINPDMIQKADAYIISQLKKHPDSPYNKTLLQQVRPFVTISREAGAGGSSVGEELVNYLNNIDYTSGEVKWTLFDKNLIEKVIEDHSLPEVFRHYLNEQTISGIQDTFERLMGLHPGMSMLASKTCNTILSLASIGNVVIVGRGSNILTKNLPGGFHVRLIAETESKVQHLESFFHFSRQEAIKHIEEEDTKRREYVKKLFNKNVTDPLLYDLVIRTSSVSYSEAARIIGSHVIQYYESRMRKMEVY
jgi:cytidylate kinase